MMKRVSSVVPGIILVIINALAGFFWGGSIPENSEDEVNIFHQTEEGREVNTMLFSSLKFTHATNDGDGYQFNSQKEIAYKIVDNSIRAVYLKGCKITSIRLKNGNQPGYVFVNQFNIRCGGR